MAEIQFNRYGKFNVQMLRVVKDSPKHEVYALTGQCLLQGKTFAKHYYDGDNSDLVPTETQKNTFYVLSKKYKIDPLEKWVLLVAQDYFSRHKQIEGVFLHLDQVPWERVKVGGKEHNHTFSEGSSGTRFVTLQAGRDGKNTLVAGFKDFKIMKTTQSGFEGYVVDEYTTLKPTKDRVMSTKVYCEWSFGGDLNAIDYNEVFNSVQRITIETFAGPADTGVYSASVQQTIYQSSQLILQRYPFIETITFKLPNIHYYLVDFAQFKTELENKGEVFFTFEGAHGQIEATFGRPKSAKL